MCGESRRVKQLEEKEGLWVFRYEMVLTFRHYTFPVSHCFESLHEQLILIDLINPATPTCYLGYFMYFYIRLNSGSH